MAEFGTTPFEDLILGSQFLPALATLDREDGEPGIRVGVLQCRRCAACFLQVREALSHYRLHVFETHKEHFTVVAGGVCPLPGCPLAAKEVPTIHFHCAYCCFTSTEIMDLPLHMEKRHLAFYREVSLVLRGDDVQRTKVYTCGECGSKIQGTVSIVQHLLAHDTTLDRIHRPVPPPTTLLNGGGEHGEAAGPGGDSQPLLVNGVKSEMKSNGTGEKFGSVQAGEGKLVNGTEDSGSSRLGLEGMEVKFAKTVPSSIPGLVAIPVLMEATRGLQNGGSASDVVMGSGESDGAAEDRMGLEESMQVEINPLDLLTTVMEEDQRSDQPLFPPEHFLLSLPTPTHFLEGGGEGGHEDLGDGSQVDGGREDEEEGEDGDGTGDVLLDHPGIHHCDKCEETFKYQHRLVAHKLQVHQATDPVYECQVCGAEFSMVGELRRHVSTHTGPGVVTCGVCSLGFPDRASLKVHALSHGGSTERSNKCESCSSEFPSKSELTRHIVKYQGTCNPSKNAEGVRCATCGEGLATLEALKEHRRTAHPTPDPPTPGARRGFECDYCGKTFNCRSNLRDHLVVHTGEKPYPCDICGKSFSFIHNMKTHRLTHNEGRNEVCPYCDKAYKSKISLYYHMKKGNCRGLSTKEVPEGYHRCTECLQMFASEERFRGHKEKGHCQTSHRCQHCGLRCSTQARLQNHLQKGLCQKKDSSGGTNTSSDQAPKKRRSNAGGRERAEKHHQEEIVCERCNYTKDCCCTFSCNHCGKRVFSIMAYTLHSDRTCPVQRQRRDRIRMAIMEKRRRREMGDRTDLVGEDLSQYKDGAEGGEGTPGSYLDTITSATRSRASLHRSLGLGSLIGRDGTSRLGGNIRDIKEPRRERTIRSLNEMLGGSKREKTRISISTKTIPSLSEKINVKMPVTENMIPTLCEKTVTILNPVGTVGEKVGKVVGGGEDGDGDDSSSGSLTDLSTFTTPNLLQPVTSPTDE